MKERQPRPLVLGRAGVVERLVGEGRTPIFSAPVTVDVKGLPKKRVPCAIPPEEDGQDPDVIFLSPGNATQIMSRVKHTLANMVQ